MFLRYSSRKKDGKEHRYWSIAEKRRVSRGRTYDRHVLYLGEINDGQREAWLKSIEAFDESHQEQRRLALFPADRAIPEHAREFVAPVVAGQHPCLDPGLLLLGALPNGDLLVPLRGHLWQVRHAQHLTAL